MTGIWIAPGAYEQADRDGPSGDVRESFLPDHIEMLQDLLPPSARQLAVSDLVVLYRTGSAYHGLYEGIFPHSCAPDAAARFCVKTAVRRTIYMDSERTNVRGSHRISTVPPPGAEVFYVGDPFGGFIGKDSLNACDRAENFVPYYRCRGGEMRFVRGSKLRLHERWLLLPV